VRPAAVRQRVFFRRVRARGLTAMSNHRVDDTQSAPRAHMLFTTLRLFHCNFNIIISVLILHSIEWCVRVRYVSDAPSVLRRRRAGKPVGQRLKRRSQ
jgi:hypothetical protein